MSYQPASNVSGSIGQAYSGGYTFYPNYPWGYYPPCPYCQVCPCCGRPRYQQTYGVVYGQAQMQNTRCSDGQQQTQCNCG